MSSKLKTVNRRLLMALLLVMSAASGRPSSRLMASEGNGEAAENPQKQAELRPVADPTADIPFTEYDAEAEQILLTLANQARAQAGAPSLSLDPGLSGAARAHAEAMVAAHQLSHQFEGEPSLAERLGSAAKMPLDQEGENVAFDFDAEKGHQHLMLSPP